MERVSEVEVWGGGVLGTHGCFSEQGEERLNKKAAARAPQPKNDKGTERDLGTVNRRTPRRQFANCIEIEED